MKISDESRLNGLISLYATERADLASLGNQCLAILGLGLTYILAIIVGLAAKSNDPSFFWLATPIPLLILLAFSTLFTSLAGADSARPGAGLSLSWKGADRPIMSAISYGQPECTAAERTLLQLGVQHRLRHPHHHARDASWEPCNTATAGVIASRCDSACTEAGSPDRPGLFSSRRRIESDGSTPSSSPSNRRHRRNWRQASDQFPSARWISMRVWCAVSRNGSRRIAASAA